MPDPRYGTERYRKWNRDRMRRRRREGVPWDRNYEDSDRGMFIRETYDSSVRRMILRSNLRATATIGRLGLDLSLHRVEPKQTMAAINRWRDTLRMIERCGGWERYKVLVASGL